MRVFWWQGGLHFEPENDDERGQLLALTEMLKVARVVSMGHEGPPVRDEKGA
jgi:hypothetical protein